MRAHLASADAISYMAVADEVKRRLKRRAEGRDFASWLEGTVGELEPDRSMAGNCSGQFATSVT